MFLNHKPGLITGLFSKVASYVVNESTFVTITGANFTAYGNKIAQVTIAGIDVLQNSIQYNIANGSGPTISLW